MQIVGIVKEERTRPFRFDGTLTDNEKLAYLVRGSCKISQRLASLPFSGWMQLSRISDY